MSEREREYTTDRDTNIKNGVHTHLTSRVKRAREGGAYIQQTGIILILWVTEREKGGWEYATIQVCVATPGYYTVAHDLLLQGTSASLSKILSGITIQCWWNHVWHPSHSAILSPSSSGKQQDQWRSTARVHLTPIVLHSPTTGKRERQQFLKQSAKYCLISLWLYFTLHG